MEQAFRARIMETPEDDAPRLVFADWLEERGMPRATLIRAQCALEDASPFSRRAEAISAAAEAMLREHQHVFAEEDLSAEMWGIAGDTRASMRSLLACGTAGPLFDRGFFSGVRAQDNHLLAYPQATPALRSLDLDVTDSSRLTVLLNHASFSDLQHLTLRCEDLDAIQYQEFAEDLLRFPLEQLRSLSLEAAHIPRRHLARIIRSGRWEMLRTLNLNQHHLRAYGAQAIAETPWPRLERLFLDNTHLDDRAVDALIASPNLNTLQYLDLRTSNITRSTMLRTLNAPLPALKAVHMGDGARVAHGLCQETEWDPAEIMRLSPRSGEEITALRRSPNAENIGSLRIDSPVVTDALLRDVLAVMPDLRNLAIEQSSCGAEAGEIIRKGASRHLAELDIHGTPLREQGWSAILSGTWPKLESLVLDRTFQGKASEDILGGGSFPALEALACSQPRLSPELLQALGTIDCPSLSHCTITYSDLDHVSVRALLEAPWLQNVTDLNLENNKLGVKGLAELAAHPLPSVRHLHLGGNRIALLGALRDARWEALELLDFSLNPIGDAGLRVLLQCLRQFPRLQCLNLVECDISDAGLAAIRECPEAHALKEIRLYVSHASQGALAALQSFMQTHGGPDIQYIREDFPPRPGL